VLAAKARPRLDYTVFFENSRCATASARTVTVIDMLDERYFDIASLRIGAVSIGGDSDEKVAVFDEEIWGRWELSQTLTDVVAVVLDPARELGEECAGDALPDSEGEEGEGEGDDGGALGDATRTVEIGDVTVDVTLRESPDGPGLWELVFDLRSCPRQSCPGFLPPNDCATHQGEGWVSFSLLATDASEVENDVDVLFDDDERRALSHHVVTSLAPLGPPTPPALPQPPDASGG